jgi:hypothetical protein
LSIGEQVTKGETVRGNLLLNRPDCDKDRGKGKIDHDSNPEIHHRHIESIRALRPVGQGQNKTGDKRSQIEPLEYHSEDRARRSQQAGRAERSRQNMENEEEIPLWELISAS